VYTISEKQMWPPGQKVRRQPEAAVAILPALAKREVLKTPEIMDQNLQ
jgi:hypothetical protein